jgi:low temperature requirement protein LtrA
VLLLLLAGHQVKTSLDLSATRATGTKVWADVTRYDRSDRKDVTMVELDLVATLPDGTVFERTRLNLPYTIGHRVEKDSLLVIVQPGAAQEVVIDEIARTQISIARSNAVMAFIAALMAFWGVFAWNRWLNRTTGPSGSV